MSENENDALGFNRRDFLKGGSAATLMTMLGGVELLAQTNAAPGGGDQGPGGEDQGGGHWPGRLGPRDPQHPGAELPQAERRRHLRHLPRLAQARRQRGPGRAAQTDDYKTILANKDIQAVIIATPTDKHKDDRLGSPQGRQARLLRGAAGQHHRRRARDRPGSQGGPATGLPGRPADALRPAAAFPAAVHPLRRRWARPSWRAPSGTRRRVGAPLPPTPSTRRR